MAHEYYNWLAAHAENRMARAYRNQSDIDFDTASGLRPNVDVTYDAVQDAARVRLKLNSGSLSTQVRPGISGLGYHDTSVDVSTGNLLFTWDAMWDDTFLDSFPQNLQSHKAYQLSRIGSGDTRRIELRTRFSLSDPTYVADCDARRYVWSSAGDDQPLGRNGCPGFPGWPDTDDCQVDTFEVQDLVWTRFWVYVDFDGGTNGEFTWWMADENNTPIKLFDAYPMTMSTSLNCFWFEYNTSQSRTGPEIYCWFRNYAVLQDVTDVDAVVAMGANVLGGGGGNPPAVKNVRTRLGLRAFTQGLYGDFTVKGAANTAPVVNAGLDQVITLPFSANLVGSVTDDGLPNPPGVVTALWTMVSGPGLVTFGDATLPMTTASFSVAGVYELQLEGDDGTLQTTDTVQITVNAEVTNIPPVVDAGVNQTIRLSGTASLDGTITDDGIPNPPAATTAQWSVISGPGLVDFTDDQAVDTTATFSAVGVYVLQLEGHDSLAATTDTVQITVDPDVVNTPPVVDAGPSQVVAFPTVVNLDGMVIRATIEGYGKNTVGGLGGTKIAVTRSDDPNPAVPGTFRWACEQTFPRIITFNTTDPINLDPTRDGPAIRDPFVTIDGGPAGMTFHGGAIRLQASEIFCHNIRSRLGTPFSGTGDSWSIGASSAVPGDITNIVLDHCSISWSTDENLGINGGNGKISNVSIQWCYLTEPLGTLSPVGHAFNLLVDGNAPGVENLSLHYNFFGNSVARNPTLSGMTNSHMAYNLIYNARHGWVRVTPDTRAFEGNFIGNAFVPGPNSVLDTTFEFISDPFSAASSIYLQDNYHPVTAPNAAPGEQSALLQNPGNIPIAGAAHPLETVPALTQQEVLVLVPLLAGCGSYAFHDIHDIRSYNEYLARTGTWLQIPPS